MSRTSTHTSAAALSLVVSLCIATAAIATEPVAVPKPQAKAAAKPQIKAAPQPEVKVAPKLEANAAPKPESKIAPPAEAKDEAPLAKESRDLSKTPAKKDAAKAPSDPDAGEAPADPEAGKAASKKPLVAPPGLLSQVPTATPYNAPGLGKIDLNRATFEQIQRLPGVGLTWAPRILAGRPYRTFGDLARDGIPFTTIDALSGEVELGR